MSQPIVRQALYLEVADRLRAMIHARALCNGEWIDELRLAGEMGISRTPLREALKVLATEGLVRLEPRRGCFVNELSTQDLEDIFPLMAMLEGRCAFEAARKASDEELAALEPLHAELAGHARAGRIDAYYQTNYLIHEAVQALAGNQWLSDMVGNLRKVLSLSRHRSLARPGRIQQSCAEHLAIFDALKAHDSDAAQALAHTHLMRQLEALRALANEDAADPVLTDPIVIQEPAHVRTRQSRARAGRSHA
ncbi:MULTISPECIES: GntR family transcriptional regulator [Achromobacter]|uniref:GntR family transcriptional regulator n=1 Tax=Achromobacter spanius TaxID=217203 RepID=A0ABY8H058_9BURK|nr:MULTISPECIES: GntR family transcriptional regulator [Achromobacter]WAI86029.1 GntR family transcriptional regulator [Achromobacter spanius]WEX96110.1 GntR family transcriptional regulator [Achromobacter sp. SS2-2022]WFP10171.1 GntR family transcriptional regulator [Achromobacter spanius]